MKNKETLLFCKCGRWHNETVKCPECETVAFQTMEDIKTNKYGYSIPINNKVKDWGNKIRWD
jgi:hypothetical protein